MSLNAMFRDLDIVPLRTDGRRLEVVAEGLTLYAGCQLALDATVVSPLHGGATHRRRADIEDGVGRPGNAKEGRTPSCARATAVRVWWSLREKSVEGGLKRPRRSCGLWLAPRRRLCRDGCTAVPDPLGTGDGHASWLALRRRQWLTAFWARRVLPEQRPGAVSQRGGG